MQDIANPLVGARALQQILAQPMPEMMPLMRQLWPICRSITGPGVRETLDILGASVPLERYASPSGSQIYDWTVPPEWSIRDAYILDPNGTKIVDFQRNNLHVVGYSEAVDIELALSELQQRLHSIPDLPDAIPYITSFYKRNWGFCLSDRQRKNLKPGRYRCVIESTLDPKGRLDFAQAHLGAGPEEILFSTYICHPSMANNELSGPVVQSTLLKLLAGLKGRRLGYRGAFTTETLGTLCFLSRFEKEIKANVSGGCVISCVGDDGPFTFVRSRIGSARSDRLFVHTIKHANSDSKIDIRDWYPIGTDERQYCSPGFNLPMGSFSRSRFEDFPQYHTSLDNFDFVSEQGLQRSLTTLLRACQAFEMNLYPVRTNPYGEPQLGKRDLYSTDRTSASRLTIELLFILGYADGAHDMLDIAEKASCPIWSLLGALESLLAAGLVTLSARPVQ